MKKITILFITLFICTLSFGQNLIVNGDFEIGANGDPAPSWSGYKNRITTDDITSAKVGQIENGDGSLFQQFAVTTGEEYLVQFDYRWVSSAAANSNMVVRIKDADNLPTNLVLIGGTASDGFALNTAVDQWFSASFSFVVPSGITAVRFQMFKGNGNKPLNVDNVTITNSTLSVNDFEQYNFKTFPNPVKNELNISASSNIDRIEIYSILGQKIIATDINSSNSQINISSLDKGIYILKTYIDTTEASHKFIKE